MLTFKEVAKKILKKSDTPLSAREITELALEEGILQTEGKTPEATMAAHIYTDIKKNKNSVFLKVGRGKFSLKERKENLDSPELLIEKQNEIVRRELRKKLHEMDANMFEYLIGDLLQKIGYENIVVTKQSGDKGIDVQATLTVGGITSVKSVIQAKRYSEDNKIGARVIRELRGSAAIDQRGLVITTSSFVKGAITEAKEPGKMPVALVDGERLLELMFQYGVGVKQEEKIIYTLDEDYFETEVGNSVKALTKGKNLAVWPLPGGAMNYIETLNMFLQAINDGINTKDRLIKWYKTQFDNVNSDKTAGGYINVPRSMGLVDVKNGQYVLTDNGQSYYATKNIESLYEIICNNIFGFEEILQFLATSEEPQTEQEILEYLQENYTVEWTTSMQVTYRLLWLVNLGKVEKNDIGYELRKGEATVHKN